MKTNTRREVIEAWNKDERYHDFFVCPDCRDILTIKHNVLSCYNEICSNEKCYAIETGAELL